MLPAYMEKRARKAEQRGEVIFRGGRWVTSPEDLGFNASRTNKYQRWLEYSIVCYIIYKYEL